MIQFLLVVDEKDIQKLCNTFQRYTIRISSNCAVTYIPELIIVVLPLDSIITKHGL